MPASHCTCTTSRVTTIAFTRLICNASDVPSSLYHRSHLEWREFKFNLKLFTQKLPRREHTISRGGVYCEWIQDSRLVAARVVMLYSSNVGPQSQKFTSAIPVPPTDWPRFVKMVNGSRYYRALESVSIASALSTALTIYPCQIRVHQTLTVLNSNFLELGRRSGGRPQRTVYPRRLPVNCDTQYVSRHRNSNPPPNLPIVSPTRYQ